MRPYPVSRGPFGAGALDRAGRRWWALGCSTTAPGWGVEPVFGCVTRGNVWRFLRLSGPNLLIGEREYYLATQADVLAGILLHILRGPAATTGQAA